MPKDHVRILWTSAFDPLFAEHEREACADLLRKEFKKEADLSAKGYKYYEKHLAKTCIDKLDNLSLPNDILIIPVMVSGFKPAVFVASKLTELGISYQFALAGYDRGINYNMNGKLPPVGRVYFLEGDKILLKQNLSSGVLIIDDIIGNGDTMKDVHNALASNFGFERVWSAGVHFFSHEWVMKSLMRREDIPS